MRKSIIGNRYRHTASLEKRKPIIYEHREGTLCALVSAGKKHYALVDIEDVPKVENEMWQYSSGYAVRNKTQNNKTRKMHRVLIAVPDDMVVDHINGDKLDNRKINLRVANKSQNELNNFKLYGTNVSGKTGVSWHEQNQMWRARIIVEGKRIEGGCFVVLEDAIRARLNLETEYCGDFAPKRRQPSIQSA